MTAGLARDKENVKQSIKKDPWTKHGQKSHLKK
jgi:hypothetical protein